MLLKISTFIKRNRRAIVLYNICSFAILSTGFIVGNVYYQTIDFLKERRENVSREVLDRNVKEQSEKYAKAREETLKIQKPGEIVLSAPAMVDDSNELFLIFSSKFGTSGFERFPIGGFDIPDFKATYGQNRMGILPTGNNDAAFSGLFGAERNIILYSGRSNLSTVIFKQPTYVSAIYKGTVFNKKNLIVFQADKDTNGDSKIDLRDCQNVVFYDTLNLKAVSFEFPNYSILSLREIEPGIKFLIAVRKCSSGAGFSEMEYKIYESGKKSFTNLLSQKDEKVLRDLHGSNR